LSGPINTYVGVEFTKAGGLSAKYLAKWTISSLSWNGFLGETGVNNYVRNIFVLNNKIYLGGDFTGSNFDSINSLIFSNLVFIESLR
jgi:hypothetical protein